jgi:hypothetical protein
VDLPLSLHDRLATAIVLYFAVLGAWGLALGVRNSGPTRSYRGALVIAEAIAIVQGMIGALLLVSRGVANWVHILYGFALIAALPTAATFLRDRQPRGQSVALGFAALFAMGLALRGCTTAR